MTLVEITAPQNPYHGMPALISREEDMMIILGEGYIFDFYHDERVPMYRVLAEDEAAICKYVRSLHSEVSP